MTATGFVGSDPQQLDAMAERFDQAAESLESIRSAIGSTLGRTHWQGRDSESFRELWHSRHTATIAAACGVLREAAKALRVNANQQRGASEAGGASPGGANGYTPGGSAPSPGPSPAPGGETGPVTGTVTGNRDWHDVQKGYDSWASGTRFAQEQYQYQCTSYANFRWHELGYEGDPIRGNGWQMAANAGQVSDQPSLHAMASYGNGSSANHVMIVEEIRADGTVRFSEMNTDRNWAVGNPDEYRDTREIRPSADGKYYVGQNEIRFAAFRK